MMRTLLALAAAFLAVAAAARVPIPRNIALNAPFTPFSVDGSGAVNLTAVPLLAADAAKDGVNLVWVPGGLGQFDTLSLDERMQLAEAWVVAGHQHGLCVCVHVGTTVQKDAVALAAHALSIGADVIASVPPYYSKPATVAALVSWLQPVAAAAGDTPFLYYHIPASTGVTFPMMSLFPAAIAAIPTWAGVKFVSADNGDWAGLVQAYGGASSSNQALLFAPEPKLQGVGLGARSAVLAESFFAPTWLRMCDAVVRGDWAGARREQMWKLSVAAVFSSFAGDAERTVYRAKCGLDLGPPRLPDVPITGAEYQAMVQQLTALGFFNQTAPPPGPCML
jgi:N-acetylneuraminate lyase